jgi:hypothetical protein
MKHSLLLFAIFLLSLGGVYAQSDLAVVDINASSDVNNWVPEGLSSSLEVTVQNVDSFMVPAGDSALVSIQYGTFVADAWVHFDNGLDTMETYTHNFGSSNRLLFSSSLDTALLIGMATHLADTNLSNNQFGETFYASTIVNNDWHAGIIKIIAPSNLNFFDVDNNTNSAPPLSHVEVDLVNEGTVTYLFGTLINYEVYLQNDVRSLSGYINASSVSNGDISTRSVTNQALLPVIPDTAGTYQLCARSAVPNDLTANNDAACMIFKMVDNYDPTDPVNWPFAVDEIEDKNAKVFMTDNQLILNAKSQTELEIIDLSGKIIFTDAFNGSHSHSMSDYNAGIYFVRLIASDASIQTEKVFVH